MWLPIDAVRSSRLAYEKTFVLKQARLGVDGAASAVPVVSSV